MFAPASLPALAKSIIVLSIPAPIIVTPLGTTSSLKSVPVYVPAATEMTSPETECCNALRNVAHAVELQSLLVSVPVVETNLWVPNHEILLVDCSGWMALRKRYYQCSNGAII